MRRHDGIKDTIHHVFILDKPAFMLSLIRSVLIGHVIWMNTTEDGNASVEDLPGVDIVGNQVKFDGKIC